MRSPWARLAALAAFLGMAGPAYADFDRAAAAFANGNYAQALAELRPLADQGDPRSQYAMGIMAENGFGMAKDLPQAASWYRKAAEKGNTDAQFNLGAMYEHGIGMPVNYAQAAKWYRPAAESGDIDALCNLGVLYATGRGVKQDKVLALALYNVSVAFETKPDSQAARNRQGLANSMSLDEVQQAMALTTKLLEPNQLKPGLRAFWQRHK